MKYFKFTSFVIAILFVAGVVMAGSTPYVKVLYVSGSAEYLTSGESQWKEVKTGLKLYSGDSVKTNRTSSVEIAFDRRSKNIVSIRPGTLTIIKLDGNEKIELVDGEVFALIQSLPRGSSFEVRTPTAVCAARGTGFGAKGNKNGTTAGSYEDNIYVNGVNKDGSSMEDTEIVEEGYQVYIKLFGGPSGKEKIDEAAYEKWLEWKENLLKRLMGNKKKLKDILNKIENKRKKIDERKDEDRIRDKKERCTEKRSLSMVVE